MIRIALLLATLAPLTACIGPSRTPGRLGGALLTLTGVALTYNGESTDCEADLGCAFGGGMQTVVGIKLLALGITTLLVNDLRHVPSEGDEPASVQPAAPCAPTTMSAAWYTRRDDASRASCSR